MAFEPDKWADGEEGETPITAAELNRMEAAGDSASKSATWGSVSNKPSTFPPATHQHVAGDIETGTDTDLQETIDNLWNAIDGFETRIAALEANEA